MTDPANPQGDRRRRPPRWSRSRLRTLAWITGIATFVGSLGVLGASPKPESTRAATVRDRPSVLVRRITRRIVIVHPSVGAPVAIVPPSTNSTASSSGSMPAAPPSTGGS
jgi:hypothetical protein